MPGFLQLQIASKMSGTMEPVISKFIISLVHGTLRPRVVRLSCGKLHQPLNATIRTSQIFYHLPEYHKFIELAWAHDHKTHLKTSNLVISKSDGLQGPSLIESFTFNSSTCAVLELQL
ncbi:hypothetical protein KC19_1G179300 [Ceratodon purpureus]|uniref:Uncharacterized protein n=1 Tax=Ceratodon purpureus TaxID=3225 RepID=A0A8T0J6D7_CERPU|nr:hypothetical protein KC19_1G179300 [Ceratodon purpureus]